MLKKPSFFYTLILMLVVNIAYANSTFNSIPSSSLNSKKNIFTRLFLEGEWYASWGYNREFWSHANIHVVQPSLGNNLTFHRVRGIDEFSSPVARDLFVPQYNIRIGRFVNEARSVALELNLDHTRYNTAIGQIVQTTGTIDGRHFNQYLKLYENVFSEVLHNGANHLMLNAVYRFPLLGKVNETFSTAGILKAGAGIMLPHTSTIVFDHPNDPGSKTWGHLLGTNSGWWQLNGYTAGMEAGFRFIPYKPIYLEFTDKIAFSYFYNLPVYKGTIHQNLFMNEIIISLGFSF